MVRLSFVEFKAPQKFDNNSVTAISNEDYGPLLLDGFTIYIGKHGFPLTEFRRWINKDEAKEAVECPDCKESFADNRGLGAHRYFKHDVQGNRPVKEKKK